MNRPATAARCLAWSGILALTAWATADRSGSVVRRPVDGTTVIRDLVYREHDGRRPRLDLHLPRPGNRPSQALRPAVVLVHGGSWVGGSRSAFRADPGRNATRLAEHGMVVIAVDYLPARPGRPSWPEAIEDIRAAVRWTRSQAATYRIDPDRIALLGQSAGAHLAMMLATEEAGPIGADSPANVRAVISFYGPTDLESLSLGRASRRDPIITFLGRADLGGNAALRRAASPLNRTSRTTPPMLLFHGSDDRWVPPEQSRKMADALGRVGVSHRLVIVEGARHGFETIVELPNRRDLMPEILAFLAGVWNVSPD